MISTQGLQDPISSLRNGGRGFGLPSSDKFRSGHMPSRVIPVSHAIPRSGDESASGSDMDIGTDSEDDDRQIGEGSHLNSSPKAKDDRIPISAVPKHPTPLRKYKSYASDKVNSDFSSQLSGRHVCTEEDGTSDLAAGSKVSSMRLRSHVGVAHMDASESSISLQTEQVSLSNVRFFVIKC